MTLNLFTGRQNEGKTLALTVEAFKDFLNGRKIYSNVKFSFPHILINKDFLLYMVENGISLPNITFVLDEFWLWNDSRKRDTTLSYFYLQSSKNNMNVLISAQTDRQIDVRLRENIHFWSECKRKILYNKHFVDIPKQHRNKRLDLPKELQELLFIEVSIHEPVSSIHRGLTLSDFILLKQKYIHAKPFYSLYDTTQKIKIR